MEIISLTILSRRGVAVNEVQLIDIDDIAAPLTGVSSGANSAFSMREGKKGPFPNSSTNTAIVDYVVDETLAQIAVLAGSIFTVNVLTYKGRPKLGAPSMGFNAKFISARVIPWLGGSKFMYQEDSDPDGVEYTCRQTPAQILAQITNNTIIDAWTLDGNANGIEKSIGTTDNFDLPFITNGVVVFRLRSTGEMQYPLAPSNGYVLTSDATGNASWQAPGGGGVVTELDPVISQLNAPPGGPAAGDRYLVGTAPTGLWSANPNHIAEWDGAAWIFTTPSVNDYVYVTSTLTTLKWNGATWIVSPGVAILQNGNSLGAPGVRIGTNDANPVWIKYNNTLRVYIDGVSMRTNNSLFIGGMVAAPSARLHVKGTGSTSVTLSLKIENSLGVESMLVRDDGVVLINSGATNAQLGIDTNSSVMFRNAIEANADASNGVGVYGVGAIGVLGVAGSAAYSVGVKGVASSLPFTGYGGQFTGGVCGIEAKSGDDTINTLIGNFINSTGVVALTIYGNGSIKAPLIQTGNAGLTSGFLYKDTAANILANGDYVIGMKA